MKITTDVNSAGFRPTGNVLSRPADSAENRSTTASDAKFSHDVINKLQKERSLIDALAIAQSSRELVQKAINISSRLMSLASEAMVSGKIDTTEVASQVSGIQSSMTNYGERVSVPAGSYAPPADDSMVKLEKSFDQLKEFASEMIAGRPVPQKKFEFIETGLKQISAEIDGRIKNFTAEFGRKIETGNHNYDVMNSFAAEYIVNNPQSSLISQGNINSEMAGKLTMT
jgi:hypothetical protein